MQKQNWTRIENLENHHKAHKKSQKKTVKVLDSLPLLPPSPIFFSVFFKYFDKTPQDSQNILFPCFRLFPG